MNIHEYQAKEILYQCGVNVPKGYVAENVEEALEAAKKIERDTHKQYWVIKAQVHAGGRGKAGGVKLPKTLEDVATYSEQVLGMTLINNQTGPQGKLVRKILIAPDVYYPGKFPIKEYYIGVLLNRNTCRNMIMYSAEGGVDIEEVADKNPNLIYTEEIDPEKGLLPSQVSKIATQLNLEGDAFDSMCRMVEGLYKAYIDCDASLVEINPLVKTSDNKVIAGDAKVQLDENAFFRHPEYKLLRDIQEEDPQEVEADKFHLNFVKVDGNIGCMVNGAGLAMATMDIIKLSGSSPANFLDVGGTANAERVEAALNIILQDPQVKGILINIFGGIVRCDRVAQGIVDAYKKIGTITQPIIVRLQGTNAIEAKKIIEDSGLKVISVTTLDEAAEQIRTLVDVHN